MQRRGERVGDPEWVSFTLADGRIVQRLMRPVLDEFGGVVRWQAIEGDK